MFLFKKRRSQRAPVDPLDEPLLFFDQDDPFTSRDAFEGVQIFGGIGSGKTSGSGAYLAKSFLSQGFGGLVLTAKTDEPDLWRDYAKSTGRSTDLLFFGEDYLPRFNALEYERSRPGRGAGFTENLVQLFDTLGRMNDASGGKGNAMNAGAFWRDEQRKIVRNAIDLLILGQFDVSFPTIQEIVLTAPQTPSQLKEAKWKKSSLCAIALEDAKERCDKLELSIAQERDLKICSAYWEKEFPNLNEKTRSIIVSMVTGITDIFVRGLLRKLFSEDTTLTPEDSFRGRIIVLDLPQKLYNEVGVMAQVLFKFCWQRAVERRSIDTKTKPVFLWADEAQYFVNEHDVAFQTTARASRVSTVFLTQNLPNYIHRLGGSSGSQPLVNSLLGNLSTKIFHNNTCVQTNAYASRLFSTQWREEGTRSYSINKKESANSFGESSKVERRDVVEASEFSSLRKGGPNNNYEVEAIIHQGGKIFSATGINALKTAFYQKQ